MHSLRAVTASETLNFHILEAFCDLDAHRQMVLCDQLFHNERESFSNTVRLLFPEASMQDISRLEKFLRMRFKR